MHQTIGKGIFLALMLTSLSAFANVESKHADHKEHVELTGFWYDVNFNGVGLHFSEIEEQGTFISYYGYDADGKSLWLLSENGLEDLDVGESGEVAMNRYEGGTFANPKTAQAKPWGKIKVKVNSCKQAAITLTPNEGQEIILNNAVPFVANCSDFTDWQEVSPEWIGMSTVIADPAFAAEFEAGAKALNEKNPKLNTTADELKKALLAMMSEQEFAKIKFNGEELSAYDAQGQQVFSSHYERFGQIGGGHHGSHIFKMEKPETKEGATESKESPYTYINLTEAHGVPAHLHYTYSDKMDFYVRDFPGKVIMISAASDNESKKMMINRMIDRKGMEMIQAIRKK